MRKVTILLILCCLTTLVVVAQTRSFKRGISYNIPSAGDVRELSKSLTWYYNWGHTPPSDKEILDAIEIYKLDFIPMIWGLTIDKERLRTFYKNNPQIKYILGFNEPNFTDQARIGPVEAASKWHLIEELADEFNLKIVGPAMNFAPANGAVIENGITYTDPFKYLDDFFAACPDCRVDYIAAHCYMNFTSSVKWYIEQYKKYGKPIWLTEFCAWENGVTPQLQKEFMVETVNYLESDPDVYRYAWFIGRTNKTGEYPYMQLLGKREGELTDLGKLYVEMSSFDTNYYPLESDTIHSAYYVDVSDGLHLEKTTDVSGRLMLTDFYTSRWASYNIDVTEAKEYQIECRVASQFGGELVFSDTQGKQLLSLAIEPTGGLDKWKTVTAKIAMNAGRQQIKVESNKGRVNFNWWKLSGANSGIDTSESDLLRVYPNPVDKTLYIESESESKLVLTDMMGRTLIDFVKGKEIDFSSYKSGVYMLSIEDENGHKSVRRIIKR